jgi:hypothetical protein
MSVKQSLIASTALVVFAVPASAAITPAEAWTSMQTYYANAGFTVTAQREDDGDDLILRDMVITSARETGDVTFNIPELSLERDGDGVDLTMSDTMTVNIPTIAPDGSSAETLVTLTQKGLAADITGEADDMNIDFKSSEIVVETSGSRTADDPIPMVLRMAFDGLKGTETVKTGDMTEVTADFTVDSISYTMTGATPPASDDIGAAPTTFNSNGSLENAVVNFELVTPADLESATMTEAVQNGLRTKGALKFGKSSGGSEVETANGMMKTQTTSEGSNLNFSLDASGGQYSANSLHAVLDLTLPDFPLPVHAEMASAGAAMKFPTMPGNEASPVGIDLRLENLTVNEELWGLFDPSKKLPRSPATVIVALDGMARLTGDFTDSASDMTQKPPFELESMSLTELKIALMGADLTGTGTMTMDNTQPMPVPAGAVDLRLEGGNALIDNLVETGLVPSEQLMGIRMMLGLFAVPAGDDVMTSKIEMREDGGVYANGQRLR